MDPTAPALTSRPALFNKYFQSELSYLRELGSEFAHRNPALSGLFAEQGGDPDVDRLLEGFAFLSARVRERIDRAVPEVVDALAEMTVPQYTRPLPACSVVQFYPQRSSLRTRHRIGKGTELGARPIDGTTCLFRTTNDLDLWPMSLERVEFEEPSPERPELRLTLAWGGNPVALMRELKRMRLFLHGPLGLSSTLYLWLMRHLDSVVYRSAGGYEQSLGRLALEGVGVTPEQSMLPWPELAPEGLRLVLEYFTLPQKLFFIDLTGLDRIPSESVSESFELVFRFRRPPALPERLDRKHFRLHCVPVVNLFETSADPIARRLEQHEYLVRASGINPHHMEVYDVRAVTGLVANRGGRRDYTRFYSFDHLQLPAESQAYFLMHRRPSPLDEATDTYLSVSTPSNPQSDEETLSLDILATNRLLASELRAGDISVATPRSPSIATFENITQVTLPIGPRFGDNLRWRLFAHLALNVRTLSDSRALRSLLAIYNYHDEVDTQVGRQNRARIEAIRKVEVQPARRMIARIPARGLHTFIEVEGQAFASEGDVFAFGCALDWLFATETPINSFHQLTIRVHPSASRLDWPPRTGVHAIY